MKKRQKEIERVYEEQWDGGRGSHHPDYDPEASGDDVVKASRETEELYNALVKVGGLGEGARAGARQVQQSGGAPAPDEPGVSAAAGCLLPFRSRRQTSRRPRTLSALLPRPSINSIVSLLLPISFDPTPE